ncbi:hypothetical protein M2284_004257 [Rhodococcus sp. LBL1]|nr:hypothetical protein [Rhodococcus sp. LBL1]MDH6684862.1 hypothetical protein [Rhodococcus sp. LBL2]
MSSLLGWVGDPSRAAALWLDPYSYPDASPAVTTTRSTADRAVRTHTPNFWWPTDRSWCAATGIDDEDTLVVSVDRSRLETVHRDPRLETQFYSR